LRIDYAIPCRYVEANANLATLVGAGIDTWWVQEIPAALGLMVAVRAVGPPDQVAGTMIAFHSHVEAPDGTRCGDELDQQLGPVAAPDARQDWALGIMFGFAIRWQADVEGTYTIHLRVDDDEHPLPMHVVHGPPPGQRQAGD
jgi:hypothetical protein